jgi:omega-6 fatty acid desaturase (delta-12 desaturase)
METSGARSDREVIDATRPFASEDRARSWLHVTTTLALLAISVWCALRLHTWPVRALSSIVAGLTLVRGFILFHDFFHGAILRGSIAGRALFTAYGLLVMTPPRIWRETHNYHHAHNGKIVGSHVGSYPVVTVAMWSRMSPLERFGYRAARHPLTIALGYFTVFAWGMCISPFLRAPKKNLMCVAALATQVLLAWLTVGELGWSAYGFGVFAPLAIATAAGSYLFYAQHTFPGVIFQPRESWSYVRAALESSSYMPMGPVMAYFTGNIGFHHVHHLNSTIPFYRLPEAMQSIPELRSPRTTRLRLPDIFGNFRIDLWDPTRGELVPFEAAARAREPSQAAS